MLDSILANCVLVLHFAFISFVVVGGFLALKWRRLVWLHLPCAAWGALIEFTGWICPLTPIEISLRRAGGAAGYRGGFVDHYLLSIIYPHGLTRGIQIIIGIAVIVINLVAYGLIITQSRRGRRRSG